MSASLMTARFGELPFVRSENRTALHARLPDASFDKCSVLEIKNSALFLAIAVSDIKDIKRGQTFSATLERPGRDVERRSARLIIDYFGKSKTPRPSWQTSFRKSNKSNKSNTAERFRRRPPEEAEEGDAETRT